jgi:hypothetical protein
MKRFKIGTTNSEIISHAGLSLIGQAIKRHTRLTQSVDKQVPLRHGIRHSDILMSYMGLLSIGKNDFEAINGIESELYFMSALGLERMPSEATLRQRMDTHAKAFAPLAERACVDFLKNIQAQLTPVDTGHIPLDMDVTPLDNSKSRKEKVSRTYKAFDGYAPMAAYVGSEGYCLEFELREGKQHCQKGTPEFLHRVLKKCREITNQSVLVRLDGGNDSLENIDTIIEFNEQQKASEGSYVDFIIKWNPRGTDVQEWLKKAEKQAVWAENREGKRTGIMEVEVERQWRGYTYKVSRVMRIVERTIDRKGQCLLEPEIELEGWWASLSEPAERVIKLYNDHGTSEQFHSEFKTDLDIERLPSGKFATNQLVLTMSALAYNILRWIGQNGLLAANSPKRHKAKRRRIKTVMQELMYVAAKIVKTARQMRLLFSSGNRIQGIFYDLYAKISSG